MIVAAPSTSRSFPLQRTTKSPFPPEDAPCSAPPEDAPCSSPPEDAFRPFPPEDAFRPFPPEDAFRPFPPEDAFRSLPPEDAFCSLPSEDASCLSPPEDGRRSFTGRREKDVPRGCSRSAFLSCSDNQARMGIANAICSRGVEIWRGQLSDVLTLDSSRFLSFKPEKSEKCTAATFSLSTGKAQSRVNCKRLFNTLTGKALLACLNNTSLFSRACKDPRFG